MPHASRPFNVCAGPLFGQEDGQTRPFCIAPAAKEVYLTGEFNGWNPGAHPMKRQPDGAWLVEIPLHHGHHQYRFVVDGRPVLDPRAQGVARNHRGERVSLLAVS